MKMRGTTPLVERLKTVSLAIAGALALQASFAVAALGQAEQSSYSIRADDGSAVRKAIEGIIQSLRRCDNVVC
jgi:hypothetical protein